MPTNFPLRIRIEDNGEVFDEMGTRIGTVASWTVKMTGPHRRHITGPGGETILVTEMIMPHPIELDMKMLLDHIPGSFTEQLRETVNPPRRIDMEL